MNKTTLHQTVRRTSLPGQYTPLLWADNFLFVIYLFCFLIGIPGNIMAMKFFIKERRMTSYLFLSTAFIDVLALTVKCIPIGVSLLFNRLPMIYSSPLACNLLGMLQNATIMSSVFIVAVLSSTRTYSVVFPLKPLRRKIVGFCMVVFFVVLTLHEILPVALGQLRFAYSLEDVICWDGGPLSTYDDVVDSLFLAVPIIPIGICCIVSVHQVYFSKLNEISRSRIKRSATITIIIYTITYIILNIPNFVNYVLWDVTSIMYSWPGPLYNSLFMQYYSWNISGELCLVLNSTFNPLIYLLRIQKYRLWVKEKGDEFTTATRMSVIIFNESVNNFRRISSLPTLRTELNL